MSTRLFSETRKIDWFERGSTTHTRRMATLREPSLYRESIAVCHKGRWTGTQAMEGPCCCPPRNTRFFRKGRLLLSSIARQVRSS
jgi:hypothetical protein